MEENIKNLIRTMQQINSAYKEYQKTAHNSALNKGIGNKAYITRKINLVREELLRLKKSL